MNLDHAVVDAAFDPAIVQQEGVGNPAQPCDGRVVVLDQRLVAVVARRHHQHPGPAGQQEVVQRRVGQHDAQRVEPLGDRRRDVDAGAGPTDDDRAKRPGENRPRGGRYLAEGLGGGHVCDHQREWLGVAPFARPQAHHGGFVVGTARQVKAPEALDCDDLSRREHGGGFVKRVVAVQPLPGGARQPDRRPALGAGHGLGVKAARGGVGVLARAERAHREIAHRRVGSIVRDALDDGVPRPAVGAVDERVGVSRVGGVGQFGQAIAAGGGVDGDLCVGHLAALAGPDLEVLLAGQRGQVRLPAGRNTGQGGQLAGQPAGEILDRTGSALDADYDAAGVVGDVACQAQALGQAINEGPEPHALDLSGQVEPPALDAMGLCHGSVSRGPL